MKWVKCRHPQEWFCDKCGDCGGCNICPPQVMHYRGEEALCERCFPQNKKDKPMKQFS